MAMAAVCGLLLGGCGDDPVAPPAPPPAEKEPIVEVKTPVTFVADWVYCWQWPEKKPGGEAWDTFGGNPDIFFQVGNCETNMFANHQWEIVTTATFPGGCRMNAGDTFTINMWDADSPSADDKMSSATFSPLDSYRNRNEETEFITLSPSGGAKYYISGKWIY